MTLTTSTISFIYDETPKLIVLLTDGKDERRDRCILQLADMTLPPSPKWNTNFDTPIQSEMSRYSNSYASLESLSHF